METWRDRREQRRWRRQALRRLEELDRIDREQGLGAMPLGTSDDAHLRPGGTRRRRRRSGPVLPGLMISGILAGAVMLHDPSMTGYRFRQLVDHLGGRDGGDYAFMVTTPSGDPVGWDHCRPIHFVVNPEGAPAGWETVVQGGVDAASEASGFEFQYDGTSAERSTEERTALAGTPPPVLLAWADAEEVPELAGSTAGIGGSIPQRVGGRVRFVTGTVVLDTDAFDRMEQRGDLRSQELILAHELGHVLGLDHVDDIGELMNAEYIGQTGFGPGDREGLEQLHELPCA